MKKLYIKLIAITLSLVLSVSAVVTVSYAWMVLAVSPATEGMQISIGGGNTILVAVDLQKTVDGTVYHYPDHFSATLNFTQHKSYDYLDTLSGLTPVSTADGIYWFLPDYYDLTDPEVQEGSMPVGIMKPIGQFGMDSALEYANLDSTETEAAEDGSYIYLDFWAVSPGTDCTLRISTGDDGSGGSFMIGLPSIEETDGGYGLSFADSDASACVRVGFLVNPDLIMDDQTMPIYQKSAAYSDAYTKLKGSYTEPGGSMVYSSGYRFTIYEPNGDYHPFDSDPDGSYAATTPIAWLGDGVGYTDIWDRVTVQLQNRWLTAEGSEKTVLEQRFASAAYSDKTTAEIHENFYQNYLGGQVAPYINKGSFVKRTSDLYAAALADAELGTVQTDGATDDVYIVELEADVPQRIRMFIWLEGMDADCVNGATASSLAFGIELAGSNQKQ